MFSLRVKAVDTHRFSTIIGHNFSSELPTGTCLLPKETEMVMPGDNATMTIELITPVAWLKDLGLLSEGGKTVELVDFQDFGIK